MRILHNIPSATLRAKVLDLAKRHRVQVGEDGDWIELQTGQEDPSVALQVLKAAGIKVPALEEQ